VFQKFNEYIKTHTIVTGGSVDQYARYVSRYLYFLEQTTSKEGEDGEDNNGFIHHISEARFDAFVEWYGKRAEERGYADNDQKTPSSALSHLRHEYRDIRVVLSCYFFVYSFARCFGDSLQCMRVREVPKGGTS
jgi:hypothetical protein